MATPPLRNQGFRLNHPLKIALRETADPTAQGLPRCLPKRRAPLGEVVGERTARCRDAARLVPEPLGEEVVLERTARPGGFKP